MKVPNLCFAYITVHYSVVFLVRLQKNVLLYIQRSLEGYLFIWSNLEFGHLFTILGISKRTELF